MRKEGIHHFIDISSTFTLQGSHQALLKCDVINVESPLFLSLTSQVHGLAVSYRIARPHPDGPIRSERFSSIATESIPVLSFIVLIMLAVHPRAFSVSWLWSLVVTTSLGSQLYWIWRSLIQRPFIHRMRLVSVTFLLLNPPPLQLNPCQVYR